MDDLTLTPPIRCIGCGLKTKNMKDKGQGWLMVRLSIPGIAIMSCSKCHSVFLNTEALANVEKVKESKGARIQVVPDMSHIGRTGEN